MTPEASVGPMFWILAIVTLVSGFLVVSLRNIFHCALFLILALFGVAGIFVLLHAEFLAAVQVLIYVGAVAVLMLFAIMLTSQLAVKRITQTNQHATVAVFVCLMFVLGAWILITNTRVWKIAPQELPADNIITLGKLLMTQFMLPFEVVSILLLAALIGAVVLARGEKA